MVHICVWDFVEEYIQPDVYWLIGQHWMAQSLSWQKQRSASKKNEGRWKVSDGMGE